MQCQQAPILAVLPPPSPFPTAGYLKVVVRSALGRSAALPEQATLSLYRGADQSPFDQRGTARRSVSGTCMLPLQRLKQRPRSRRLDMHYARIGFTALHTLFYRTRGAMKRTVQNKAGARTKIEGTRHTLKTTGALGELENRRCAPSTSKSN